MSEIDIRHFKEKASMFPEPVRTLILSEKDSLPIEEYISKLGTWEKLLKIGEGQE